jgi:putative oxidoreductase
MGIRRRLFSTGKQGALRDVGLLVLRLGFGGTLAVAHGLGKLQNLMAGSSRFPDPLGVGSVPSLALATFAEFLCALALAVGFMSRLATVPLVITFVVAVFLYHGGDPLAERELALVYLLGFLALLFTGPGRLALDEWLRRK